MERSKYTRYESPELIAWKQLSHEEQLLKVQSLHNNFKDKLEVISVKDQMIEVNIFVSKEQTYELLVNYETSMRKQLNNIPIIVLLKERLDENRKRK